MMSSKINMTPRYMLRAPRFCQCRSYSSGGATPTIPPMLLKIRKDMKTAMQEKDTNRLAVLRSIISQTLNASKTSSPICTDMQMLALLRKTANASKTASQDFKKAGREDLVEKEESQIRIMEEYVGSVEVVGKEDMANAVKSAVESLTAEGEAKKVGMGEVLKKVLSKDLLGETNVEKSELVKIIKETLAKS